MFSNSCNTKDNTKDVVPPTLAAFPTATNYLGTSCPASPSGLISNPFAGKDQYFTSYLSELDAEVTNILRRLIPSKINKLKGILHGDCATGNIDVMNEYYDFMSCFAILLHWLQARKPAYGCGVTANSAVQEEMATSITQGLALCEKQFGEAFNWIHRHHALSNGQNPGEPGETVVTVTQTVPGQIAAQQATAHQMPMHLPHHLMAPQAPVQPQVQQVVPPALVHELQMAKTSSAIMQWIPAFVAISCTVVPKLPTTVAAPAMSSSSMKATAVGALAGFAAIIAGHFVCKAMTAQPSSKEEQKEEEEATAPQPPIPHDYVAVASAQSFMVGRVLREEPTPTGTINLHIQWIHEKGIKDGVVSFKIGDQVQVVPHVCVFARNIPVRAAPPDGVDIDEKILKQIGVDLETKQMEAIKSEFIAVASKTGYFIGRVLSETGLQIEVQWLEELKVGETANRFKLGTLQTVTTNCVFARGVKLAQVHPKEFEVEKTVLQDLQKLFDKASGKETAPETPATPKKQDAAGPTFQRPAAENPEAPAEETTPAPEPKVEADKDEKEEESAKSEDKSEDKSSKEAPKAEEPKGDKPSEGAPNEDTPKEVVIPAPGTPPAPTSPKSAEKDKAQKEQLELHNVVAKGAKRHLLLSILRLYHMVLTNCYNNRHRIFLPMPEDTTAPGGESFSQYLYS